MTKKKKRGDKEKERDKWKVNKYYKRKTRRLKAKMVYCE